MRYALATIGPVGSAGAQFLMSFILLHMLEPQAFGRFSFLLLLSQFSWGVWSALFCAPLPILHQASGPEAERRIEATFSASLLGAALAFLLFALLAMALGEAPGMAALYAAYAALALLRWFARAGAYAVGEPLRATASDLVYTLILLASVALLPFAGQHAIALVWGAMMLASGFGLIPFGMAYARRQFLRVRAGDARHYAPTWRDHGRWALLGVVTTEATANAHAYLVTLILGPTAFAPIAASALLIRPITVAMNALTEFERARMARDIGAGHIEGALGAMRFFRIALVAAWIATAIGTVILFAWNPRLVFPAQYAVETMAMASALWLIVTAVRLARTPDSAMLQAGGAFRPLAFASVWSSVLSVAIVLLLIPMAGPIGSLGGIIIGEALFAIAIWRTLRQWLSQRRKAGHAQG